MATSTRSRRAPIPSPRAASPAPRFGRRDLLGLQDLDVSEIRALLLAARPYAAALDAGDTRPREILAGKTVGTVFFEDSTRTRTSFALAAIRLGAAVVDLSTRSSSVNKGETIADTAQTIEAMGVHAIVVRHAASGSAHLIARAVSCCVINAGDGRHEHPTQGLLDIFTLAEAHSRLDTFDLSGLRVAIIGDVANSRVARSAIAGMTRLGAEVICAGPPSLCPPSLSALGVKVTHEIEPLLPTIDAAMVLRLQTERGAAVASPRDYAGFFQIDDRRAAAMKPSAIVMHPGPMNRGVEVATTVADGPRSRILRQVTLGVAVRMAAIELCLAAPRT